MPEHAPDPGPATSAVSDLIAWSRSDDGLTLSAAVANDPGRIDLLNAAYLCGWRARALRERNRLEKPCPN